MSKQPASRKNTKNKPSKATIGKFKKEYQLSLPVLLSFVLVFASIGSYFLYRSFAATPAGTFGKTTIGAYCDTFSGDLKRVNRYSVGATVSVSKLNLYLKPSSTKGSQVLKGLLYGDNNGAPGPLIATTNQLVFYSTASRGWYNLPFATPPTLNSGNYWIGVISGNTPRVAGYCYDTTGKNVRDLNNNIYVSGPSSPFGTFSQDNRAMSLNASYTIRSGGNPAAPTANLTASLSSVTAGQSALLHWSSTGASACSAPWAAAKTPNGSQTVAPTTTTSYTIICRGVGGSASAQTTVSVAVPNGGGNGSGSGSCSTTLSGSQTGQLQGNTYHIQSNEWASSAPFTICTNGGANFKVITSGIHQSSGGAPGAYPSLYKGCHWGYCTSNSGMPVAVSAMTSTAGKVTTSYSTTVVTSGAWDDSYDNWFNATPTTSSNSSGLEMMIWIDHMGPIQPAGRVVASGVSIGGRIYNVWYGGSGNGGTVSYVLTSPATSVTNLDLGPLAADSVSRGFMQKSWYLIDVEAGFEPWQGGQGLTANSFSVAVK